MGSGRISVVIPTYNCGQLLLDTLKSALSQTHADREIIIVDDGSTDGTADLLEPYLPQIRYVRQDRAGAAAARNHGFALATGDYIAPLDADDLWKPRKLEVQHGIASRAPNCGLIVCDGFQFEGTRLLRRHLFGPELIQVLNKAPEGVFVGNAHRTFIFGPPVACPAQTLIPRAVIEAIGPMVDGPAEDYDYYLRITQRYPAALHRHQLTGYRYRPQSTMGARESRPLFEARIILPVLRAHVARCSSERDRNLVIQAIERYESYLKEHAPG